MIPIVFIFNQKYALPASIAIQSLIDSKSADTHYHVIVLHNGLSESTREKLSMITPIEYHYLSDEDIHVPHSDKYPKIVYYRLFIADILRHYDKVIYSDVDVLFTADMTEIFHTDMTAYDWAGVIAEHNRPDTIIHTYFPENKNQYIYMSGFMLMNLKRFREYYSPQTIYNTIQQYEDRLKLFDLDVLNIMCDSIQSIDFSYCVLENIFDLNTIENADEYPFLSKVYTDEELYRAKKHPKIIHYAGRSVKIWHRKLHTIPDYYLKYVLSSAFYVPSFYAPALYQKIFYFLLRKLGKLLPHKHLRQKIRQYLNEKTAL